MKVPSTANFFERARLSLPKVSGRTPSRAFVARQLGVSERTIYSWERNVTVPQKRLIPSVATVLNVSIEELGQAVAVQQAKSQAARAA